MAVKAVRFHELGGPDVLTLEEVSIREPDKDEVALKVEAVGLNRAESMYFHGQYFEQPAFPSGLGYEAVGVVTAVGPGGDASLVGQRFGTIPGYSMNKYPALAEEAVVPASVLAPLPPALSATEGAAAWMQYCTAYGALVGLSHVGAGDFVLITAASSSVGLAAIQIARAEGATAIATTRTSAKKQQLLDLGAEYVIATQEEDLPARVAEITGGKGARVVFDPVGGDYVSVLVQAVATEGTIYLYGGLSGQPTPYPVSGFSKAVALTGYTFGVLRNMPERWEAMKQYIYDKLADGTFKPKIDRIFPLAETADAYRYLESNAQIGKIVITI